jgi:predicted Rossmann fold flavoprotein
MNQYDVIILGAGAAGLFAAGQAGQRGLSVALLEKAEAPGKKILISGGGRCNFTNLGAGPANYLSANPHFAKSALARYSAADFIALVDRYGIAWHEKTLGQLFCDGSAKQIVAMLLDECPPERVTLTCDVEIAAVTRGADGVFAVAADDGRSWQAPALVIATGGPSIPKMGASDFAYRLARQFGLKVVEPRPALVPLTLGGEDALFRELSGVAAPVLARAGKTEFAEAALFTHKGLSGPAILQVSSYWRHGEEVGITFLPDAATDWLLAAKRDRPRTHLRTLLRDALPARLPMRWLTGLGQTDQVSSASWAMSRTRTCAPRRHGWPTGGLLPMAPRALPRPKSPPAASPRRNSPAGRWRPARCRVSSPSGKRSM